MAEGLTIISETEIMEPSITAFLITIAVFGIISIALVVSEARIELSPFEVAVMVVLLGVLVARDVSDIFAAPTGEYEYVVVSEGSTTVGDLAESLGLEDQEHFVLGITVGDHEDMKRGNKND